MMADLMKKFEHWNVRILRRGDRYGLNDCLTHEEDDPIIEFYGTNRTDDEEWKRGHFVAPEGSKNYAQRVMQNRTAKRELPIGDFLQR